MTSALTSAWIGFTIGTGNSALLETSMALLSIAINYDYLPIYQR
jgi:hypothetical protein